MIEVQSLGPALVIEEGKVHAYAPGCQMLAVWLPHYPTQAPAQSLLPFHLSAPTPPHSWGSWVLLIILITFLLGPPLKCSTTSTQPHWRPRTQHTNFWGTYSISEALSYLVIFMCKQVNVYTHIHAQGREQCPLSVFRKLSKVFSLILPSLHLFFASQAL